MRRFVFNLFLFVSVLGLSAQDWSGLVDTYGPLVAKVEVLNGGVTEVSGTAFVISTKGRLLTCAHVVTSAQFDKNSVIQLTFPLAADPKKIVPARIELISDELDLAVLDTGTEFPQSIRFGADALPKLMSDILVIGYPLGMNFKATSGNIQAFQDVPERGTMLDLSSAVDPGNSGGPVFSRDGKAIGIVTARIPGYNFNLALPIRNAIDFLAMADHPVAFQVDTTPSGARVFLNGVYKGTTPLELRIMSRSVELSVEKDGFDPAKQTLTVENSQIPNQNIPLTASASTTAHVTLQTTPPGARVWVNNTELGKTPLELTADKGSKLRYRFETPGYHTLIGVADLTDQAEQTIHFDLVKGWF